MDNGSLRNRIIMMIFYFKIFKDYYYNVDNFNMNI